MQKDDAEQNAIGISGLRGGELGQIAKDVFAKVGIYFHAGGGTEQSRQEEGQIGKKSVGQPGESLLGRASANGKHFLC